VLSGETTNTNLIVFGWSDWTPTIYHTQGEHANHYVTDVATHKIDPCSVHYKIDNNVVLPSVLGITISSGGSISSGSIDCSAMTLMSRQATLRGRLLERSDSIMCDWNIAGLKNNSKIIKPGTETSLVWKTVRYGN
jgi:hypothetical protein